MPVRTVTASPAPDGVQGLADAGEVYLTREVRDAPGVAALLAPFTVEVGTARLKGVGQETPVFRVQPGTATHAA
jgi:class 3 adenylate cyclase